MRLDDIPIERIIDPAWLYVLFRLKKFGADDHKPAMVYVNISNRFTLSCISQSFHSIPFHIKKTYIQIRSSFTTFTSESDRTKSSSESERTLRKVCDSGNASTCWCVLLSMYSLCDEICTSTFGSVSESCQATSCHNETWISSLCETWFESNSSKFVLLLLISGSSWLVSISTSSCQASK